MASNAITKLTEEQYLALDRAAEVRSEFLDGEMIAMSGDSMRHARIQQNLSAGLDAPLRARGCDVFGSDLRVRVSKRMYAYPDISVVCGKLLLADEHQDILLNPTVIFEVLSPSTEKYDRGIKFQQYRTIESLKDYVLVSQDTMRIEHYTHTRGEADTWTFHDHHTLQAELKIDSVGISLPLSRVYDRVELPAE